MALVGYSDSEESDSEIASVNTAPAPKRIERSEGNKIKVNLASLQHGVDAPIEPAAKRQRTTGAFSGFNSLLPAPKRTAQSSLKPGIALKTSSEAAFSRAPPRLISADDNDDGTSPAASGLDAPEPVLVGKPTRFMPLSVANKKKKPTVSVATQKHTSANGSNESSKATSLAPKAKQSLFSTATSDRDITQASTAPYEPEFVQPVARQSAAETYAAPHGVPGVQAGPLQGMATDMGLSEADRRRLFGRSGAGDVKIAHFDMNSEYQSNQEFAARGEAQEHRAVRAVAPGRHSLQQLVSNVQSQAEAIEDKWAEGRRARGETSSKYGW